MTWKQGLWLSWLLSVSNSEHTGWCGTDKYQIYPSVLLSLTWHLKGKLKPPLVMSRSAFWVYFQAFINVSAKVTTFLISASCFIKAEHNTITVLKEKLGIYTKQCIQPDMAIFMQQDTHRRWLQKPIPRTRCLMRLHMNLCFSEVFLLEEFAHQEVVVPKCQPLNRRSWIVKASD